MIFVSLFYRKAFGKKAATLAGTLFRDMLQPKLVEKMNSYYVDYFLGEGTSEKLVKGTFQGIYTMCKATYNHAAALAAKTPASTEANSKDDEYAKAKSVFFSSGAMAAMKSIFA
jgi:hypothetical protein